MSHYSVTVRKADFRIVARAKPAALAALQGLVRREGLHFDPHGLSPLTLNPVSTLAAALRACGWGSTTNRLGDIVDAWLEGDDLGDSEAMFRALADHVRPGSYIEFVGADGDVWRWTFLGGCIQESYPELTWTIPVHRPRVGWHARTWAYLRRAALLRRVEP